MTTWNYRVVRYDDGDLGLHEGYYDDQGRPVMMTEQPVGFVASVEEGVQGLIQSLERALQEAQNRPMLESRDILGTVEFSPPTHDIPHRT